MENPKNNLVEDTSSQSSKEQLQLETSEQINVLEHYIYYFDYPYLTESGYVKSNDKTIIVKFPVQQPQQKEMYNYNQNVLLLLNGEIRFSYQWLPIYSCHDFYKIKDMLTKCYCDFIKLTQFNEHSYFKTYFPHYYNELVTISETSFYKFKCCETSSQSTIEVDLFTPYKKFKSNLIPVVQMYVGEQLIFSSDFDLPQKENLFLTSLILYKLIKF